MAYKDLREFIEFLRQKNELVEINAPVSSEYEITEITDLASKNIDFENKALLFNNVEGYISSDSSVRSKMHNGHFAVSFSGSYAVTSSMSILANYDQPLTEHPSNNPHPNLSLGLQLATSTHTFQIFLSNYQSIIQQANNMYNQNDYTKWQYLIGFNISKR